MHAPQCGEYGTWSRKKTFWKHPTHVIPGPISPGNQLGMHIAAAVLLVPDYLTTCWTGLLATQIQTNCFCLVSVSISTVQFCYSVVLISTVGINAETFLYRTCFWIWIQLNLSILGINWTVYWGKRLLPTDNSSSNLSWLENTQWQPATHLFVRNICTFTFKKNV